MSETRYVKPSVDGARIPDPAMGDDLPAEGRAVVWTPYWRRLELREDIVVLADGETPPAEEQVDPPVETPSPEDPAPRRSRFAPKPTPPAAPGDEPPATTETPAS